MGPILQPNNAIFNPDTISLSRWDGRDPLATKTPPASGTSLGTWFDQKGVNNLTQASGAQQPIYTNNLINGFPALNFSTKNCSKIIPELIGNQDFTCYGVILLQNENNGGVSLGSTASAGLVIGIIRRQISKFRSFVFGGRVTDSVIAGNSTAHAFVVTYNKVTSEIQTFIDGVPSVSSGSFQASNTSGLFAAGMVTAVAAMTGSIGELGLMTSVATNTQIAQLSLYLKTKWGTP